MKLGTAVWGEGASERRCLVALLGDRAADLNRIERVRLAKLGEGEPEALAEALVPPSLRRVLEAGPRALQRIKQTLAYAEKWAARGTLPESLAPKLDSLRLLPCLPRPAALRRADGSHLDRLRLVSPFGELHGAPLPTLAALGLFGGKAAGFCLAVEAGDSAALGAWLAIEEPLSGELQLQAGGHRRSASLAIYEGLELPPLRAAEVLLLPPPRLRALPELPPGLDLELRGPFETLKLKLGKELLHPTVQ